MKQNTHIYLAAQAIEFLCHGVSNLQTRTGPLSPTEKAQLQERIEWLQRLMREHRDAIVEASQVPDELLDNTPGSLTYKLIAAEVLPHADGAASAASDAGAVIDASDAGGVLYRVHHLASLVSELRKLRDYDDPRYERELAQLYLLISRFVVDAHDPLRGDRHPDVEAMWEQAATPLAAEMGLAAPAERTDLTPYIKLDADRPEDRDRIKPVHVEQNRLMEFMVERCIQTQQRSLAIQSSRDSAAAPQDTVTPDMTRHIMDEAVSGVISVWLGI